MTREFLILMPIQKALANVAIICSLARQNSVDLLCFRVFSLTGSNLT